MPRSTNAGLLSSILNTRGQMEWDVPAVGQIRLGSGQTKALLEHPENWLRVYQINFRSCSYHGSGSLPTRTTEFVRRVRAAKIDSSDNVLWWIA